MSYSGGITNGIKAFIVLGMTNATSIQIATALMRQGGFSSLTRILGGFSLVWSWFAKKVDKEFGLDVYTLEKLNLVFHTPEISEATAKFLLRPPKEYYAFVDGEVCNANCPVNPKFMNGCPASNVCPTGAFFKENHGRNMSILNERCIGCGNCGESCILGAINYIER